MYIRTTTKVDAAAGDVVCTVEVIDGTNVIAIGTSIRGGQGLAAHDARSTREHLICAAIDASRALAVKAKVAQDKIGELLNGKEV